MSAARSFDESALEGSSPSGGADIRDRLRNAAQFEPRRLPRLAAMAEAWAREMSERFASVSVDPPTVTFREIEIEAYPGSDEGDAGFAAHLVSGRFLTPGWVRLGAEGTELLIASLFGAQPDDEPLARPPSDLDRGLVALAFGTVASMASSTFAPLGRLDLVVGEPLSPAVLFAGGEDEGSIPSNGEEDVENRFVLFRFAMTLGSLGVELTVGFPDAFFAPHRRFLGEMPPSRVLDRDEAWSSAIEESFTKSDMRLDAVLARERVPLATVATLLVGQTIPLGIGALDLIGVECEDRPLFRARMGRTRENYVVRIEERIDPAEEFIDGILPH